MTKKTVWFQAEKLSSKHNYQPGEISPIVEMTDKTISFQPEKLKSTTSNNQTIYLPELTK